MNLSIQEQTERGLHDSATFLAEQLLSLRPKYQILTSSTTTSSWSTHHNLFLMAQNLFHTKQFQRCSHLLHPLVSDSHTNLTPILYRCMFLYLYSLFWCGEKRKEEELVEKSTEQVHLSIENQNCRMIYSFLKNTQNKHPLDAYLYYLFAIVSKELKLVEECVHYLEQSIILDPYLWCSWLELASFHIQNLYSFEKLNKMNSNSFLKYFYQLHVYMEIQENQKALQCISTDLEPLFDMSNNTYLEHQIAIIQYHLQDFTSAQEKFDQLFHQKDPFRFDYLDIYSNILYVREAKQELSHLAHQASQIDKFKPETCCVIGNYYSLKGDHEKSILYFQRALKLNRHYLSAWTLMGHEYVELKNTTAAVHAYRTAVDMNSRDYRAWYGLGQTYELLDMQMYAIYYYSRAAQLKPNDSRMWNALATCYEKLNKDEQAMECYQRALQISSSTSSLDLLLLFRLCHLFQKYQHYEQMVHCLEETAQLVEKCHDYVLQYGTTNTSCLVEMQEFLLFLCNYYYQQKEFVKCRQVCTILIERDYFMNSHASQMAQQILYKL